MKTTLQIPAMTSLPSTLTAKKSMEMTFSSDKIYITIFLRRIQRLQIFKIPIDVIRTISKYASKCTVFVMYKTQGLGLLFDFGISW